MFDGIDTTWWVLGVVYGLAWLSACTRSENSLVAALLLFVSVGVMSAVADDVTRPELLRAAGLWVAVMVLSAVWADPNHLGITMVGVGSGTALAGFTFVVQEPHELVWILLLLGAGTAVVGTVLGQVSEWVGWQGARHRIDRRRWRRGWASSIR